MRKSEIIRQRDEAKTHCDELLDRLKHSEDLWMRMGDRNAVLSTSNDRLRAENGQLRSENASLRKDNHELFMKIRKLERKETSFQEDLEFFVNDCTEAQARELYERLGQRLHKDRPHIPCLGNADAFLGDYISVQAGNAVWFGTVCTIYSDEHLRPIWFRITVDGIKKPIEFAFHNMLDINLVHRSTHNA